MSNQKTFEQDFSTLVGTILGYANSSLKTALPETMTADDLTNEAVNKLVATIKKDIFDDLPRGMIDVDVSQVNAKVINKTIDRLNKDGLTVKSTVNDDGTTLQVSI